MKGKEKDSKTGFPDFLRYSEKSMTGKEKNTFERELQKDPFADEAEEGFSSFDTSVLTQDMEDLEKRLGSRTRSDKRFVLYRIAASVAVLMVITTIILIVQKKRPEEIASTGEKKEITFDIQMPEVIKDNGTISAVAQNQEIKARAKATEKSGKGFISDGTGKMKTEEIVVSDSIDNKADEIVTAAAEQEKAIAVSREILMPMAARAEDRSKKAVAAEYKAIENKAPEPLNGINSFNRYIEKNIIRPDTLSGSGRFVILSFIVKLNGQPDSIKVIESPGKPFSDEAIRLLREGPEWKPASVNGVNIEDEVRVRIVFK